MNTTDHYFSDDPEIPSEPVMIEADIRGYSLTFESDRGVFSRERVDTGTLILAYALELPAAGEILDLGCGYGALGITIALETPHAHVTLVDVNSRAAGLAAKNCQRYNLANTTVLTGDGPSVLGERTFDFIVCNPPYRSGKQNVMRLLEDAAGRLRPGGSLWLVGRTKQGIKTLARDISPLFAQTSTASIRSGYRVIRCDAAQ